MEGSWEANLGIEREASELRGCPYCIWSGEDCGQRRQHYGILLVAEALTPQAVDGGLGGRTSAPPPPFSF
jgi:hypothetical protein